MSGWLFLDGGDSRVYPNLYNSGVAGSICCRNLQ
jgi:hypothetical protein